MKQANGQWFSKLSTFLFSLNYKQSLFDYYLFTKITNTNHIILLIYVDDLIISDNDLEEIQCLKSTLDTQFKIKDLGNLQIFLGFEVVFSSLGISIFQCKYALELLHDENFFGAKPTPTPMTKTHKYTISDTSCPTDPTSYRRLIGRLIYLCNTRYDLSFFVQQLSQFISSPKTLHLQDAHHVLRYIK